MSIGSPETGQQVWQCGPALPVDENGAHLQGAIAGRIARNRIVLLDVAPGAAAKTIRQCILDHQARTSSPRSAPPPGTIHILQWYLINYHSGPLYIGDVSTGLEDTTGGVTQRLGTPIPAVCTTGSIPTPGIGGFDLDLGRTYIYGDATITANPAVVQLQLFGDSTIIAAP